MLPTLLKEQESESVIIDLFAFWIISVSGILFVTE